jgi:hypothetical protein
MAAAVELRGRDAFAFTHDKIREVLYNELNAIRTPAAAPRIGETLESSRRRRSRYQGGHGPYAQDLAITSRSRATSPDR